MTSTTSRNIKNCYSFEIKIDEGNIDDGQQTAASTHGGYRRAIAPNNLQPGDIVNAETAFGFQILKDYSSQYCSNCCTKFAHAGIKGNRCTGGCQYTYYCHRQCQLEHFQIHKHTCKRYSKIIQTAFRDYRKHARNPNKPFDYEDFMLCRNVYIKYCVQAKVPIKEKRVTDLPIPIEMESLVPPLQFDDSSKTTTEDEDGINDDKHEDRLLARIVCQSFDMIEGSAADFARNFFYNLLQKFKQNNFGIQNSLQTVVASGIYPFGSILNHSCTPNCILTYQGNRQIIRVIQSVSKGNELFHSYTDLCHPTSVRQNRLQDGYGFKCQCERCLCSAQQYPEWWCIESRLTMGNESLTEQDMNYIEVMTRNAKKLSMGILDTPGGGVSLDETTFLKREYAIWKDIVSFQESKLGRYNLELYKTHCQALNVAMMLQDSDGDHDCEEYDVDVVTHAEATVDFLEFVCPEYHPLLLLQKMTLAELYGKKTKTKEKARLMYQELIAKCSLIWGPNHDYVHHYKTLLIQS